MSTKNKQKQAEANMTPGQNQRPNVSSKMAAMLVSKIYGLIPTKVKELESYEDRNFHVDVSPESANNPFVKDVCCHGYVLKVMNHEESKTDHVEAEFAAQHYLAQNGVKCPLVVPSCDGRTHQLVNLPDYSNTTGEATGEAALLNQVRLMVFVPGVPFNMVTTTSHLVANTGAFLARIHNILEDFSNPHLRSSTGCRAMWALDHVSASLPLLPAVTDITRRTLVEEVINTCHDVLTNMPQLPKGTIHGDFNYANILVTPSTTRPGDYDATGILDFALLAHNPYIYDVGVSIMYLSVESNDMAPMLVGGHFLSGYLRHRHLSKDEWQVLRICICGRYAQSLVIGAYHLQSEPDNTYLSTTSIHGWEQLMDMWNIPEEQLYKRWCDIIRASVNDVELPY